MGRKRIAFVINSLAGGGAERVMCTLLHHSAAERAEFDMTLLLLDDEPAANTPPDWVEVRQLDCRKSAARSFLAVRKALHELRPDVSLSFLTRSNMANVLAARWPCIISERANTSAHFGPGLSGAASRASVRALYPRATRVIAVSEGVANDLRQNFGVAPERVLAIPNPVDVEPIRASAAEPPEIAVGQPYIMAAGRLVKSKNFDMLIRAHAASGIPHNLLIVGEGPERAALEQMARTWGVADRVLMPGFAANPYALMRGADLFVLSSNAEGFPNVLVEAMALGVPVVATNCASGPSEILADAPRHSISDLTFAEHGVIVPPNATDAMAQVLDALVADPGRRRLYGQKAASRALSYSASAAKDRYWAVVRDALAAGVRLP